MVRFLVAQYFNEKNPQNRTANPDTANSYGDVREFIVKRYARGARSWQEHHKSLIGQKSSSRLSELQCNFTFIFWGICEGRKRKRRGRRGGRESNSYRGPWTMPTEVVYVNRPVSRQRGSTYQLHASTSQGADSPHEMTTSQQFQQCGLKSDPFHDKADVLVPLSTLGLSGSPLLWHATFALYP